MTIERRSFLVGTVVAGLAVIAGVRLPGRWGQTVPDKLLGGGALPRPPSEHTPVEPPPERGQSETDDDPRLGQQDPAATDEPDLDEPDLDEPPSTTTADDDHATASPPVRTVEVICRDALGLTAATAGGVQHRIRQLTLHHTAVAMERNELAPSRLRGHQRYHQQAGWSDIAYHYGVDLAGHVYELRDPDVAGDTFTDYDPAGHFLVVCEGDYDREQPSDAMLQRVAELFAYAAQRYGADLQQIGGHRNYAATSCPGDHLQSQLPAIEQEASRLVADEQVELAIMCGPAAQELVEAIEAGRA